MSSWYKKHVSDKSKSPERGNRSLPSNVDPKLLAWAEDKATVQPGQDGSLPAMDKFGYGAQSLAYGGPLDTGAGSGVGKTGKTHGWGGAGREGYGGVGRSEMRDESFGEARETDRQEEDIIGLLKPDDAQRRKSKLDGLKGAVRGI